MAAGDAEAGLGRAESTAHSRQEAIEDWDDELWIVGFGSVDDDVASIVGLQEKIRVERPLLLGVGGVGSSFGMALARAGVEHLHLVDMDTVARSNLNRQVLFGVRDIGERKVFAAKRTLEEIHCWRTSVGADDLDAVRNWGRMVELARDSTVVFNGVDYGSFFDYAAASLARRLGLRYVSAITHSFVFQCDAFDHHADGPCWACCNAPSTPITIVSAKQSIKDGKIESPLSAASFAAFLSSAFRADHEDVPEMAARAFEKAKEGGEGGEGEDAEAELLVRAVKAFDQEILAALHPTRILEHKSIAFIPKEPAPTLSVGSWAGTCVMGSLFSVNLWVMLVMGMPSVHWVQGSLRTEDSPFFKDVPTWPIHKAAAETEEACELCKWVRSIGGEVPKTPKDRKET